MIRFRKLARRETLAADVCKLAAMNGNRKHDSGVAASAPFATTQWSLVIAAGHPIGEQSDDALERLCEAYWSPLYTYARRRTRDEHEAQDLTQAFFERLLEKRYLAVADKRRGRFRAFLITTFKHFLSKEWEKANAAKRGGKAAKISLDFPSVDSQLKIEPGAGLTAEQHYEKQWARTLIKRVMDSIEAEFAAKGKSAHFEQLKGFILEDGSGKTYAEAAAQMDLTPAAARKAGSRLRVRFRERLRDEVGQTLATPNEIDDEIRDLLAALKL